MSEFAPAMEFVLWNECEHPIKDVGGGYIDDPRDHGGRTVYGLSLKAIIPREDITPAELGILDFSSDQMRQVTREAAEKCYRRIYWDRYHYEDIEDQECASKVFDASVNLNWRKGSSCVPGHLMAQRACNNLGALLVLDGILGPHTIAAINGEDPQLFLRAMVDALSDNYRDIAKRAHELAVAKNDPSLEQAHWLPNWLYRASVTRLP